MRTTKTLSNSTLLALVHQWMISAPMSTLLVVQVFPRPFHSHTAYLFTGHLSVRPPYGFLVHLIISSHSCDCRPPRAATSSSNINAASSLLSYVRLCNSDTHDVVRLSDHGFVSSNCHNNRISSHAAHSAKRHRAYQTNELHRNVRHPCLGSNLGQKYPDCWFPSEAGFCCTSYPSQNIFIHCKLIIHHFQGLRWRTTTE